MIRSSFKANMHVTDPAQIAQLKMRAAVGIQNYVIHDSTRCAHSCPARSDVRADVRCGAQPQAVRVSLGLGGVETRSRKDPATKLT